MSKFVSCVVRPHKGINEFVRIQDAADFKMGERVISGRMFSHVIKDGPSDSHRITVWAPSGFTIETRYGEVLNQSLEELFLAREVEPELEAA